MRALVLVGGLGTRLRPLTFAVPKPLLAVGEKPILQWIIEGLRASGVTEIVMATGYLSELVQAFCGDGSRFGLRIRYVHEDRPLGTAGPLGLIRQDVADDDYILLMNGDIITTLDFARLFSFAREREAELTVAYVEHTYQSPYGVLEVADGEVVGVREKPELRQNVSSGIYMVRGSALSEIPQGQFFTMPDLMERLRSTGRRVSAFPLTDFWLGVEDLTEMEKVRTFLEARRKAAEDAV